MPKAQHEVLHKIFQELPELAAKAVGRILDFDSDHGATVEVLSNDCTEAPVAERRADSVLMVKSGEDRCALIIESQTKIDRDKHKRWMHYVGFLQDLHDCDVILLVITRDQSTADWAAQAYSVGATFGSGRITTMCLHPIVIGPKDFPEIFDVAEAADNPMYAVLAAIAHGDSRRLNEILGTLAAALDTIDADHARILADYAGVGFGPGIANDIWRNLMAAQTYEYQSLYAQELRAEGRVEGRVEGEARTLVLFLSARGLQVPEWARERISSCEDIEVLEEWVRRAATVTSVEDLFA